MSHLQRIRNYELELVLPVLPPGGRILEIGAGAGWQVRALSERGFAVEAIDVEGSDYERERVWPVTVYDGSTIPFPDNHFDAVFSSNVLEHIPHARSFQGEIERVLKPGGMAIHILPSASWRFWTSAVFYLLLCKDTAKRPGTLRGKLYNLKTNRYPPRHGEQGNAFTEIYTFSKRAWLRLFRAAGWEVEMTYSNRLFYTGYSLFDSALPLRARRLLSYALGGSCNVICLRKSGRGPTRGSAAT